MKQRDLSSAFATLSQDIPKRRTSEHLKEVTRSAALAVSGRFQDLADRYLVQRKPQV